MPLQWEQHTAKSVLLAEAGHCRQGPKQRRLGQKNLTLGRHSAVVGAAVKSFLAP